MDIQTDDKTAGFAADQVSSPDNKKAEDEDKNKRTIHVKIFIVVILTAVIINIIALAIGAVFLTNSVRRTTEEDMLIAVDIADQYVSKEIQLLKNKAAQAAGDIELYINNSAPDHSAMLEGIKGVLRNTAAKYPEFTGLALFDQLTFLDSWKDNIISPDIVYEKFMYAAYQGGQAFSNTMYSPDGSLVIYISSPVNDRLILTAVLPGFYFSDLVSKFNFWEKKDNSSEADVGGHLIINDEEGSVISNIRPHWVRQKNNFFQMAKEDNSFDALADMTRRGTAGERGIAHYSIYGVPRICAFRPVSSAPEKWFIGIVAPSNESAEKNIPFSLLLMGLITLVLSIAAAIAAAIVLKRPYDEAYFLRKDAETMSLSKSAFLANMSHEIRTPMNSIVGFSELALDSESSPRTRDYLDKIKTNAQWLLQIINDILDISKVESGKMELENIPFDIHELFSSCRTLIMPAAVEKGLTLYFYAEPSMGKRPLGDPSRLRQVFVNLLSNAVKFTNNGMVKIHAALSEKTEKTMTMHFEVKDSGIGMTNEQIKKIFDPFIQADTGITRKYGGTGLGLTITKNIIEKMGGELTVESTPGIGSKFSFDLVFDTVDVTDDEMFENKIVLNEIKKPAFEGEVLLCEDNPMNQQVICEHLSRVGLQTVVADNGRIGVNMVKERQDSGAKQFDLIFMDIHMPVMDGLEASSRILELNSGVPIIAITANLMSNDRDIYRTSGMFDCIGKPFTSQELWRCLMKYLTPVSTALKDKNAVMEAEAEFQKTLQVYFYKSNQNKYREILSALEEGDIELAHRLTHTLKGNAGQLGKTILQKAAGDVERQLKHGKNAVSMDQLNILESELNMVLNEFAVKNITEEDGLI